MFYTERNGKLLGILLLSWIFVLFAAAAAAAAELVRTSPAADAVVRGNREDVQIKANFLTEKDRFLSSENFRIKVNGFDCLSSTLVLGNTVVCKASSMLRYGDNKVIIEYPGADEKWTIYEWSFRLVEDGQGAGKKRGELTCNAKEAFEQGDVLKVKLEARTGGRAYFAIEPLLYRKEMRETSPGVYEGEYEVQEGDNLRQGVLTAQVVYSDGRFEDYRCAQKVDLAAYLFRVHIKTPEPDSEVGQYFDITGVTRPNSRISLVPRMTVAGSSLNSYIAGAAASVNQGAIEVMADEEGNFSVHFGFPLRLPGTLHRFTVTAIDPNGLRSIPYSFSVKVK